MVIAQVMLNGFTNVSLFLYIARFSFIAPHVDPFIAIATSPFR